MANGFHTLFCVIAWLPLSYALVSYSNVFIDPEFVLTEDLPDYTNEARETITKWAIELAAQGPWSMYFDDVFYLLTCSIIPF